MLGLPFSLGCVGTGAAKKWGKKRCQKKKLGSFCCWSKDVEGIQSKRWAVNLEPPLHITKNISVSPWHIETMTSFTGWSFMKELILLTAIISLLCLSP